MGETMMKKLELVVGLKGLSGTVAGLKEFSATIFFVGEAISKLKNFALGLLDPLKQLLAASMKQTELDTRLQTTITMLGYSWQKAQGPINNFIRSMQSATTYGDEQIIPVFNEIALLTGNVGDAMEGTRIAIGLAGSGLFDLGGASMMVSQAMEGNVERLGRFIPQLKTSAGLIKENMTAEEKWAVAKTILIEKTKGQAEAMRNTLAGSVQVIKSEWGDLQEALGKIIEDKLYPYVKKIADWFTYIGDEIGWDNFAKIMIDNYQLIFNAVGAIIKIIWQKIMDELWELTKEWAFKTITTINNIVSYATPMGLIKHGVSGIYKMIFGEKEEVKGYGDEISEIVMGTLATLKSKMINVTLPTGDVGAGGSKPTGNVKKSAELTAAQWNQYFMDYLIKNPSVDTTEGKTWLPGEVSKQEWEEGFNYRYEFQKAKEQELWDYKIKIVSEATSIINTLIGSSANESWRATQLIINQASAAMQQWGNVRSMMTQAGASQFGQLGGLAQAASALPFVGIAATIGMGLYSIFGGDKKEKAAQQQADQDRRARSYGSTTRTTPINVTIAPVVSITGEIQYLGVDGSVMGERVANLIINKTKTAIDTGELNPAAAVPA